MNKKKKTILLSVLGVLLIIAIIVGTTYAFWKVTKVQEGEANTLTTTCLDVDLTSMSNGINLQTQFPITDEEGRKTEGYTFKISNKCNTYVSYDINLESLNTIAEASRLNLNYLDAIIDYDQIQGLGTYPITTSALKSEDGTAYDTRKLRTVTIAPGTEENPTSKEHTLKVWLDEDSSEEAMNKEWIGKISITGSPVTEMSIYADASGAEQPELNNGLIPVAWDGINWVKADTSSRWYDYDTQWWANAVTVSETSRSKYTGALENTPISMDDIETMWVWIPRYEYQHTNMGDQYAGGTRALPGGITINFISKDTTTVSSDNYTIHDAFWWDNNNNGTKDTGEQLAGIWVAKFEMSRKDSNLAISELQAAVIKPNIKSWTGTKISTFWESIHQYMNGTDNIYGLINSDAHLMKNMEWGAVAYFSQSKYGKYGNANYTGADKEIYKNEDTNHHTGMSSGTPGSNGSTIQVAYNIELGGTGASTTGNIYGIYDMSGGVAEYVMGIQKVNGSEEPAVGKDESNNSGWSGKLYNGTTYSGTYERLGDDPSTEDIIEGIGNKYYNLYSYMGTNTITEERMQKGDATYEIKGWYADRQTIVYSTRVFLLRGGSYRTSKVGSGIFFFIGNEGNGTSNGGSGGRPTLVPLN